MRGTQPRRILITGASSGIGAALARAYAAPGVTLHLGGRDPNRLRAVAEACRAKGADARSRCQDVTDAAGMEEWIRLACDGRALDLAIANAGIAGDAGWTAALVERPRRGEAADRLRRILAVNLEGAINTVLPAIQQMIVGSKPPGGIRGQIAIMSSLAGFLGLPSAPAYSASKAALLSLGESLRALVRESGIEVCVICPGFVRSPMTETIPTGLPFVMDAEHAAAVIKRRLARHPARIVFPWQLHATIGLLSALPIDLRQALFRQISSARRRARAR